MRLRIIRFRAFFINVFLMNSILFYILNKSGMVKYAFAIFIIAIGILLVNQRIKYLKFAFFLPWIFYILLGGVLCLYNNHLDFYSIKQSLFYLVPITLAFILSTCYRKNLTTLVNIQFVALTFIFLITGVKYYTKANMMESQYAFIFGTYMLYYFYIGKYNISLFSLILLYMANKRIAFLSAILILCFFIFLKCLKKRRKTTLIMFAYTIFSLVMYGYICIIKTGVLELIVSKLRINTMGRTNIYSMISDLFTLKPSYIGSGIGTVRAFVKNLGFDSYQLLHNDILSLYIEIGFIGFFIYWGIYWLIFYKLSKRIDCEKFVLIVGLFIYTFCIFATDNISIYINYFYPFYMMIFTIVESKKLTTERIYHGEKRSTNAGNGQTNGQFI